MSPWMAGDIASSVDRMHKGELLKCGAEWDWSEEEAAWQDSPAMGDAVRADHAAAMEWFRQAKERGENVSGITLQDTPSPPSSMC